MDIQTSPIPKRLSDSQEVNRFLNLCERFEKENEKEIIKEYASEALSRFNVKGNSSSDKPNLVASQGSRPLTISIRLSGTKEKIPISNNPPQTNAHKVPSYRQLNNKFFRVNTRSLNSYIVKLKNKRKNLLEELSLLRDESMSSFPLTPDPTRQKCQYDYMLEEAVLVANDFIEERKWKIQVAYILAHEAQAFYYKYLHKKPNSQNQGEASNSLVEQHKKIGHFLSSMVNEFWNNVKDAQNEVFHSEKKKMKQKGENTVMIQSTHCGESEQREVLTLYASKPTSISAYLEYCYRHHLTSVFSCFPTNPQWESLLYAIVRHLRFSKDKACVIVVSEEWKESIRTLLRVCLQPKQSSQSLERIHFITSITETVIQKPHTLILFASALDASVTSLPFDLSQTKVIVVDDTSAHSIAPALAMQLLHGSTDQDIPEDVWKTACFTVPAPQHASRPNRQQKDLSEGGETHLPVELHTVSLAPWQVHLRDVLLDAFEEKLDEVPTPSDVLQCMYLLLHQLELGAEDWSPPQPCVLPAMEITWPLWLWNTLIPSPYQSILTSTYDIRGYSTFNLRKKEITILLLDRPVTFNYACDLYEPVVPLKQDSIAQEGIFDNLRISPSFHPSLFIAHPPVMAMAPRLTGSTYHYKWISNGMDSFASSAMSLFKETIQPSSSAMSLFKETIQSSHEVTHSGEPTLVSPRVKTLLSLLCEGRKEKKKQLVIVDSPSMAYSITRHCYKQGYQVVTITGDPTNSNPSFFWNGPSILRFNNAPSSTIGLICLRHFAQPSEPPISPFLTSPVVDTVFVVEKPKPNYWQQVYHNLVFMLGTRKNANARIVEVMSELETRVTFSVTEDQTVREELTTSSLRTLFNLSVVKEKKEVRPALFEVFKEEEWLGYEEYHESRAFLWRENEEFPSLCNRSHLIDEMDSIDKKVIENEKKLQIQSLLADLPILTYCFSIANKWGIETSTLSAVSEPMDIPELLNPLTVTKQFEFPSYPVPSLTPQQVVPFPQTVHWNTISEFDFPTKPIAATPEIPFETTPPFVDTVGSLTANTELALIEYTPVERSLLAWEKAALEYHNHDPTTEVDSFLYGSSNAAKNRYTLVPEKFSITSSFCLGFSINKSSDITENAKNKRNRKRQRDGLEQEEKHSSGSIGYTIHQHITRPYVWNRQEDEMLCTLVMQFGTGWAFICSVFLMEQLNHVARTRKDCMNRWEFLTKSKAVVEASIPQEAKYLCIPENKVSTTTNPFFYYSYNLPYGSSSNLTHETPSPPSPFHSIFKKVQQKKVHSSLNHLIPASSSVEAKLKERDLLFANEEGDQTKRLQCYLRPDPPANYNKELARRGQNARAMQSPSVNPEPVKPQSNRVNVTPLKIQYPPNYIELRKQSIMNLPIAKISVTDEHLFDFLLQPGRQPYQDIVIPYDQALSHARHLQEEKPAPPPEIPPAEISQKPEGESTTGVPTQMNNGIVFDSITVLEEFGDDRISDEGEESESVVQSPFSLIEELQSQSMKREQGEGLPTSVMNLKLQKLPISSLKRRKRMEPSTMPHAFYTPATQLSRSNVRLLQHNLNIKKQQLRNPNALIQMITNSSSSRKELNQQQSSHQGRDSQDSMMNSYDVARQRQGNVTLYRSPQNIQYPNLQQQQKGNMRVNSMNQPNQQPSRVAYV